MVFVYNSTSSKIEELLVDNGTIKFYICGPTVYDHTHLGHARTYIQFDCIRRILQNWFGYNVIFQTNITDIDDKILNLAKENNTSIFEISKKYESLFWKSMDQLNVLRPNILTRVTYYIPKIIDYITVLLEKRAAYVEDGSVYMINKKETTENEKRGFFWDSPWSKGRPGWHIECSVVASDKLGSNIDIHGGGIDLKFPHH